MATMGRPSEYKPEYCSLLVEMYSQPSTRKGLKTFTTKNGTIIEEEIELPNRPVHVVDFCDKVDITTTTFYRWLKEKPEFNEAYAHAKEYLTRNIVDNALLGNYNSGFASLVSKNWLGWVDKTEIAGPGGGPIQKSETIHFDWSKVPDSDLDATVKDVEKFLSPAP